MAKFLSINVTAAGLAGGQQLINADQITTVTQTAATTTVITLGNSNSAVDVITLTHTGTGTTPSVRNAVNAAITAIPGGQTVAVDLAVGVTVTGIAVA
jgi:hypothetical protein